MRLASLLALATMLALVAGPSFAQTVRPGGACLQVTSAAAAGETSGIELEAGSKGAFVTWIIHDGSVGNYAHTISSATLFDTAITVQVSDAAYGQIAVTSIVRRGRDSAGGLPADGDYFGLRSTPFTVPHLFIPPGKFFTMRRTSVNAQAIASFCFQEPPR